MAAKTGLTARQRRFVDEYLIDLNATQAAVRAGYSPKTAEQLGYQLLQKPSVGVAVATGARKRTEEAEITAQDVLRGLHKEAVREGDGASHAARVQAWGLLGKYHKLFTDKIEADISADVTVTDARGQLESVIARQLATRGKGDSAQ
ncbi:MAG: terminase small subunit [Devosia sp.]|nr:terminase small subunit [Devosia sp.]